MHTCIRVRAGYAYRGRRYTYPANYQLCIHLNIHKYNRSRIHPFRAYETTHTPYVPYHQGLPNRVRRAGDVDAPRSERRAVPSHARTFFVCAHRQTREPTKLRQACPPKTKRRTGRRRDCTSETSRGAPPNKSFATSSPTPPGFDAWRFPRVVKGGLEGTDSWSLIPPRRPPPPSLASMVRRSKRRRRVVLLFSSFCDPRRSPCARIERLMHSTWDDDWMG